MNDAIYESAEDIEEAAALWVARRHAGEQPAASQAEFDAWLSASTARRVAWLRMTHGWDRSAALAGQPLPAHLADPADSADAAGGDRRAWQPARSLWRMAAAVLLGVAVGVSSWTIYRAHATESFVTAIGARRDVRLADGSHLLLNTNTRLRTRVSGDGRHAWLDQGEAFFDIAHDPDRPFVVDAGTRRLTVLGTRFSVRREGEAVTLMVVDGRVRLEDTHAAGEVPVVATRGDVLTVSAHRVDRLTRAPAEVANALSWRQGWLVFDQTPLADAILQFNRYSERQISLADPQVGQMRIGGRFEIDNLPAFVRLLHAGFGIGVRETGSQIILSAAPGGN